MEAALQSLERRAADGRAGCLCLRCSSPPPCCCCIGAPIKIFFVDEVLAIAESASTASIADVEVVVWSGGDHCMYNHMSEKHTLIADWFWEKIR